jgi:hypothetical protein
LASYFVAEQGSLPQKSNPIDSLPHRLGNVHGSSPEVNPTSGSEKKTAVIEITDL